MSQKRHPPTEERFAGSASGDSGSLPEEKRQRVPALRGSVLSSLFSCLYGSFVVFLADIHGGAENRRFEKAALGPRALGSESHAAIDKSLRRRRTDSLFRFRNTLMID
ncbi:hypothetical protein KSP40_PGU000972 [Platanthera guangdongensis]|uniref:Transmembrane protein n=1 Tax=Platanthera guangdongensis TaxID=2320717 RepID=A0ABR2MPS7_9ASPA